MVLSQRGALHALVSGDRSLLGVLVQLEEIPTWTEWYEGFEIRFDGAKSLRTVQRQLKKLRGDAAQTPTVVAVGGGDVSGAGVSEPLVIATGDGRDDGRTAAELLAEHAKLVLEVLTGDSITTGDAMRITRAVSLVRDLQRAPEEGFLVIATSGPTPKVPVIECTIVPDQVQEAYATLGNIFNCMADTADIESTLQCALEEIIQPMMAEHPYMQVEMPYQPEVAVRVQIRRAKGARISAGDWVEYRGGDDRLTKQIGAEAALGRVVEADAFSRPRVTWATGTKWLKPYSLFNQEAVHVLFADQAASAYSEAFSTYSEPALSKPPATAGIDFPEDAAECKKA